MRRDSLFRVFLLTWALTLLSACSMPTLPPPSTEPITITFACMDYQRNRYAELAEDFQKANPDVRVQLVSADEASGIQREGSTLTSGGNEIAGLSTAADTFVWFARLTPDDWAYLLDLQPFVDDTLSFPTDDFYPGALDHFRWQGALHGLPAEVLPILIFYDKTMFDEAGAPYPQIGWTWDEFLEVADRLTRRQGDKVTRYGFVDAYPHDTIAAMLSGHGVSLWDERSTPPRPLFDRSEVADVLRRYLDMALTDGVMPMPEIGSNMMAFNLANEGKAAMWTDSVFDYDYHAHRTKLGLAPFPEAKGAATPRFMNGFFASAGTRHPEAAWRWLTYLGAHYQPSDGFLPGRRSIGERMSWWRGLDADVQAVLDYALAHPAPPENPLDLPLRQAISRVIKGESGVEEALAEAQAEALALQSQLAAATPASPQAVASPEATPGTGSTIAFAPAQSSDAALYRNLAALFHESYPEITVDVIPISYDLAELAANSDCFEGGFSVASPEFRQLVRNLEPLLASEGGLDLSDFYPVMLESLQYNGELWGLPYSADAVMLYYNRARFDEAEVVPPQPGWTFDEFLSAAAALSDADRYGFTTREGAYGDLIFALGRLGARLLDRSQDLPRPTFDDPTVVAALARYADAVRQRPLSLATPSTQSGWPDGTIWGVHPAGVETGLAAMWIDYISAQAAAPPLPFEVGVAPLPIGSEASTEFEVRAYYISAQTPQPQACWQWLTFLSGQPDVAHPLPARRSVVESPGWRGQLDETTLAAYRATLEYRHAPVFSLRWDPPWMAYAYPWLDEAFQDTVTGADAGEALAEVQRKAGAYILCLERQAGFANPDILKACAREVDPRYPLPGG